MKKQIAESIYENMDEILKRWENQMKTEENNEDLYFQHTSQEVLEKTNRQFAELLTSGLLESETMQENKIERFAEKIVRFNWSLKFINKAIDCYGQTSFSLLEEKGIIQQTDWNVYKNVYFDWINPWRDNIIEAYSIEWERTVNIQKIALQELSASLIPVVDRISVMPLVGTIDTERAKLIMENLLEGVARQRSEVVLLDITGVPVVDTMVAHHIIQAADAVRLIGAKCMLVGIRPEIAQTIVTLGINLNEFTTTSTLQRGMQEALKLTNRKIIEEEAL